MSEAASPIDPLPKVWDPADRIGEMLKGKRGLIVGVANANSIAFGCAAKLRAFGAELGLTYVNEKTRSYVAPLAAEIQASFLMPLDVESPGELEAVFERIRTQWGSFDFLIHSIAFAPRAGLHGRVVDCSPEGFAQAMRVSVYSFIEMARLAEPLMPERRRPADHELLWRRQGGEQLQHHGSRQSGAAIRDALPRRRTRREDHSRLRALAGAAETRAASGIAEFDELVEAAVARAPTKRLVDIAEIGRVVAFLVGGGASGMTGDTIFVDGGLHNIA